MNNNKIFLLEKNKFKEFEKDSFVIENKKEVYYILKKNILFVENRFFVVKEYIKNLEIYHEVIDKNLYEFGRRLKSIDSSMSEFLIRKKIKKMNVSKEYEEKIRDIFFNFSNVMDMAAYARIEGMGKNNIDYFEKGIKDMKEKIEEISY